MLRLWCLSFGWSPAHDKCFIGVFLSTGVQVAQFEDVKFEAASLLSELYCQQVRLSSQTSIFCKAMYCEKLYSDRSMLIHGVLYVNPLQIIHQEWFNTWTLTCNALTCQKWLFALLFSRTWLILRSRCYGRPSRSRSRRRTGTADCCFSWRYVKPFITAHLKHLCDDGTWWKSLVSWFSSIPQCIHPQFSVLLHMATFSSVNVRYMNSLLFYLLQERTLPELIKHQDEQTTGAFRANKH